MKNWVDVNERDWFFSEITEASNIILEDGKPFIEGIDYNAFEAGKPNIYEEQQGVKGKAIFTLGQKTVPTSDNPLFVYIDGIQSVYKEARDNVGGTTDVEFYAAPPSGSIVSFGSIGKPVVTRFGKPTFSGPAAAYPNHALDFGPTYYYEPFSRQYQEYMYAFGKALKRANVPNSEWASRTAQDIGDKYIGSKQDVYMVSPATHGGIVYLPYNLNGVTCKFTYNSMENGIITMRGGEFKGVSPGVIYNNRFFPNSLITRAEAFTLIDRLRKTFYSRFSDQDAPLRNNTQTFVAYEGQRVFKLNFRYTPGSGEADVYLNGVFNNVVDYREFDSNTILWNYPLKAGDKVYVNCVPVGSRFADVGKSTKMYDSWTPEMIDINGNAGNWWADSVMSMEREKFGNGDYLIQGIALNNFDVNGNPIVDNMYNPIYNTSPDIPKVDYFLPLSLLTRAQSTAFLNRFRKWCIERFK